MVGPRTHDTGGMGKAEKFSPVRSNVVTPESPEVAGTGGVRPDRRRSVVWRVLAVPVAAAIALGAVGSTASAAPSKGEAESLKSRAQGLVEAGYPAALAAVSDSKGESAGVAVGKDNLETGQAPPMDGEVRIGSNTKTFVAVVVMQMVQEGKVGLDEPIETYLPGLIKGEGIDASRITVRQLLQHTSGLPDFDETLFGTTDVFQSRYHYVTPRDVLDSALSKPAQFEPGTQWKYTNTNYIVLGMLVERVSQRPVGSRSTSASSRSWGCPTPTSRLRGRRRFVAPILGGTTSTVRASWRILPRWIRLGGGRLVRWSRPPVSSTPSSRPSSTAGC